jgi:hypothetical protein
MSTMAAPGADRTRYYLMQTFYLRNGTQVGRLHEYLGNSLIPSLVKSHPGPKISLEAVVATHTPQAVFISGHRSVEEALALREAMAAAKGFAEWESGPEAPYEHYTSTLLQAMEYSPEVAMPAELPKKPRIFEIRQYHSPTWRQLGLLHERFSGPEIAIFHRTGIYPILYTQTVLGPNIPNLTYVIPFESLAAREKAWDAFGADPEWQKVRKESIDRGGQIASVNSISLYRAAAYSPVR